LGKFNPTIAEARTGVHNICIFFLHWGGGDTAGHAGCNVGYQSELCHKYVIHGK